MPHIIATTPPTAWTWAIGMAVAFTCGLTCGLACGWPTRAANDDTLADLPRIDVDGAERTRINTRDEAHRQAAEAVNRAYLIGLADGLTHQMPTRANQ